MQEATVHCGKCGESLAEASSLAPDKRIPCPTCGSLGRRFDKSLAATIEPLTSMSLGRRFSKFLVATIEPLTSMQAVQRRPGVKRGGKILQLFTGADPSRDPKRPFKWVVKNQVIDWLNNRYKERIVAPDGTVLRDVDHPLTEHQGRGSAKRKTTDERPFIEP